MLFRVSRIIICSTLILFLLRLNGTAGWNKQRSCSTSADRRRIIVGKDARIALAGGFAGATGTALLYPIDAAKTLRQTDPKKYSSIVAALKDLFFPIQQQFQFRPSQAYRGVLSSTLASIPSSAVYFGVYEIVKNSLFEKTNAYKTKYDRNNSNNNQQLTATTTATNTLLTRLCIHSISAICGNAASSLIFVPKEYVKQQLQAYGSGKLSKLLLTNTNTIHTPIAYCTTAGCVISETLQRDGIRGLYSGYKATILRNIPTAVLRFALYEEIKLRLQTPSVKDKHILLLPMGFVSGAIAGAIASGLMTPVDVLKTKFATGSLPTHLGLLGGMQSIYHQYGWTGLYAGAGARMLWSGAFSAVGLGTFEIAKQILGVASVEPPSCCTTGANRPKVIPLSRRRVLVLETPKRPQYFANTKFPTATRSRFSFDNNIIK